MPSVFLKKTQTNRPAPAPGSPAQVRSGGRGWGSPGPAALGGARGAPAGPAASRGSVAAQLGPRLNGRGGQRKGREKHHLAASSRLRRRPKLPPRRMKRGRGGCRKVGGCPAAVSSRVARRGLAGLCGKPATRLPG